MRCTPLKIVGLGAARGGRRSFERHVAILIVAVTSMLTGCTLVFPLVGGTVAGIHNLAVDDDVPKTPPSPTERDRTYQACISRRQATDAAAVNLPDGDERARPVESMPRCHPAGEDNDPTESNQWSVGKTMGGSLLVGLAVDLVLITIIAANPPSFN